MRRLSLSEYHVLNVLSEPIKQPIPNLNIELFEGDNYIYLEDLVGNKLCAEYLIKNDFTDNFVSVNQMISAINQTAGQIELTVNQKLESYSTTEETNAIIQELANQINLELSKKINGETITGAYLILKINEDTSEAKLKADKISLEGMQIDLTANNITFNSTKFSVNEDGKVICDDITATGGKIGGWNIQSNELNNGKVFIKDDGSSTIYTVADLFIIKGYIMGTTGFEFTNPTIIKHYDLNNDGVVDSKDYFILKNLIGLEI